MNKSNVIVATASLVFVFSTGQVSAEDEVSQLQMSAELGLVITSGNSETSSINAKFDATHEKEKWRHNFHAEAVGASSTDPKTKIDSTSSERYLFSGKSDYKFDDIDFLFGSVIFDKDRFSGYEYQTTVAFGYGRRLLNEKKAKLDVEIGAGARKVKESNSGSTDTDGIVRLGAKYEWNISEASTFTEEFSYDYSKDLATMKSVTALTAKVDTRLAMKIALSIRNNSEVPTGNDETDTETSVTLVYSF